MYKQHGTLTYSPSDLTRYMDSPFAAWMDRFALEYPDRAPAKDPQDALMATLAQKGYAHEDAQEARFIARGLQVLRIEGADNAEKSANTIAAMQAGADVIVQARLQSPPFAGYADFLVKVTHAAGECDSTLGAWHYEVWDTKLANSLKAMFVVQLCCYGEMLQAIQGRLPQTLTVALGNGEQQRLQTRDYFHYYQALKTAFLAEQQRFSSDAAPDPADSKSWGDWSGYAESQLLQRDHLFQVATITRGQIKKLQQAGISSMQALADSTLQHVPGINPAVLARLKAQARIQKRSVGKAVPAFEIITPDVGERSGLALLPPHSDLDVFFDIEGYPLDDGGLEYLWGATYFDAGAGGASRGERRFKDFWAHNREQEKRSFQQFIEWVYARWQQDPAMHIYHYANYEIAACRKLMGRYGVCEFEVDQLLRNEVFVDLYKIVKGGVLLGEPRYSIKNVEHLYRGQRDTAVGNGGDSVVVYEQWRELHQLGEQGDTWQSSEILNSIRDYNIDDCDSTQELVDWLREQQARHDIAFLGKTEPTDVELSEEITERTQLRDRLLAQAEAERTAKSAKAMLSENMAWVLEFHRREAKPVFWRLFERLGLSHVELIDDLDCLASCERTSREPFKRTARTRNLGYEYRFDAAQEFKGAQKNFYLLGVEDADGRNAKATYLAEESDLENGLIMLQCKTEPPPLLSLVPDEYVNPNPIPQAIDQSVAAYEAGKLSHTPCAIVDFLRRARPRINGHDGGALTTATDPGERLQQIIALVRNLDRSYLTIQGPPGAGKSYTGKHVIAALLQRGARIGIASNSHKAINNLLLSTAQHCNDKGIAANFVCTRDTEPGLLEAGVTISTNAKLTEFLDGACVVGTTAWGFARDDMAEQLDYLFVDEAGQVAVANLIAMSRSADNLVLMGDQMQLGQPSQGSHPADSGLSVLDYLLAENPTIAADMGVFLGTTYRMHSAVNRFVSEHIYDGKLDAHPANDQRIIEVPAGYAGPLNREAGLLFVPVAHTGNMQASDEEVASIKALAHDLLGRTFHTGENADATGAPATRAIGWDDILFVAPYNHQVNKLRMALGDKARVGSVDKFQGQEAPIVFLSMCASDASESPRGLDFLLDKHRLNVALSRAKTLAIVVANPALGQTAVDNLAQLRLLNLFNAMQAAATAEKV